MTIEELRNEKQFFEYMHVGVNGFKKLRDEEIDIYSDYVKRNVPDPELIGVILELAMERRKLIIQLRDKKSSIKYGELSKDPTFIAIKNKLTGAYPQLANLSSEDFLDGIANAVAHGEYKQSFDFAGFYKLLWDAFRVSHMSSIKNSYFARIKENQDKITYEKLESFSTLKVNMRYGYKTDRFGNKTPNTYSIGLGLEDLTSLLATVTKHYVKGSTTIGRAESGRAYVIDKTTGEVKSKNIFDDVQMTAFENVLEDYSEFIESDYMDIVPEKLQAVLGDYANSIVLSRVGLIPILLSNKIFNLDRAISALHFRTEDKSKGLLDFDSYDLIRNVLHKNNGEKALSDNQKAIALYSAKIENLYFELLITELISLLERLEQKDLIKHLRTNQNILQLADKLYGEGKAFFVDDGEINAIKLIRNSLVHMNYVFDPQTEKVNFYALKKQNATRVDIDKNEIEYRISLSLDELEVIKDVFFKFYLEQLKKEIELEVNKCNAQQAIEQVKKAQQQRSKPKTPPPYSNPKKKRK